jgi:hypothetical protein
MISALFCAPAPHHPTPNLPNYVGGRVYNISCSGITTFQWEIHLGTFSNFSYILALKILDWSEITMHCFYKTAFLWNTWQVQNWANFAGLAHFSDFLKSKMFFLVQPLLKEGGQYGCDLFFTT